MLPLSRCFKLSGEKVASLHPVFSASSIRRQASARPPCDANGRLLQTLLCMYGVLNTGLNSLVARQQGRPTRTDKVASHSVVLAFGVTLSPAVHCFVVCRKVTSSCADIYETACGYFPDDLQLAIPLTT